MMANTSRKRPNTDTSEEVNKKNVAGIAQAGMLPEGFQYVIGPTGPMLASNGHLVPIITPVQWLPQQQQVQQQQPQPMEITMTTVSNNSTASIVTSKKPQQQKGPIILTMPAAPQVIQQQHQTTIDSFNEKHLDVEEHFRRSLGLLTTTTAATTAATNSPSTPNETSAQQANTNSVNVTVTPHTHAFVGGAPLLNAALQQQQQQITLANTAAAVYAAQQKENASTDQVGTETAATPTMTTPTKSQHNPHNIENLIATSTPTNTSTTLATRDHSSSQLTASSYEPPSQDQQGKTDVHIPTAIPAVTNPYATILLTPGGLYHQAAAAGALNYTAPMINMDPNLLALLVPQVNAQAATLLQQGNAKLSSEDVAKMLQGVPIAAAVPPTAGNTAVESSNEATMVTALPRNNFKPVYLVNNSETGHHQLRSISGSNIVTLATNMDNGSAGTGSLSTQNSSSQIVPTPMSTDDGGGQVMETTPAQQQRSVHSEVSSVSDSVEDHFARALGGNWRTKFN